MDKFKSIRPYQEGEIFPVLEKLINNKQLINVFGSISIPKYLNFLPFKDSFVKRVLKNKFKEIKNIHDYQLIFEKLVTNTINKSMNNFMCNGIENVDNSKAYLYISNHRDITLDAALLNYCLFKNNHDTFNMAVGNNLMSVEWAADLMRLNKSFIIQRSGKNKKDIYKDLLLASEFIHHCIFDQTESVWIAQKQGRAKDGLDFTDPAILKMIHLASKKDLSVSNLLNRIQIVPVAISYEYDPNDLKKAYELQMIDDQGLYQKHEKEDLISIANGIQGYKGNVLLNIGKPLHFNNEDDYEKSSYKITSSIIDLYKLHPTNFAALELLNEDNPIDDQFSVLEINTAKQYLKERIKKTKISVSQKLFQQYANPVLSKAKQIS